MRHMRLAPWHRALALLLTATLLPVPSAVGQNDGAFPPGTALRVTIWQEPDLSGEYSIDSSGNIQFPLIGRVQVSRYTSEGLQEYLRISYGAYLRSPIIQVTPLIRVSVLGEVKQPGLYRVEPDSPLWDLIARAGGPSPRGDLRRIVVMRGGTVVKTDLLAAYERGDSLRDIGFQSGDQIVVPPPSEPFPWRTLISVGSLAVAIYSLSTRTSRK